MFSTKFYVDANRKDSLMLRITNNRKKVEMSMGLKYLPMNLNQPCPVALETSALKRCSPPGLLR